MIAAIRGAAIEVVVVIGPLPAGLAEAEAVAVVIAGNAMTTLGIGVETLKTEKTEILHDHDEIAGTASGIEVAGTVILIVEETAEKEIADVTDQETGQVLGLVTIEEAIVHALGAGVEINEIETVFEQPAQCIGMLVLLRHGSKPK
jgi:hypothetical protein